MPEFGFIQSGLARTVGSVPATTQGTTLTAGGSANTKGSYVELSAATERDSNWALVHLSNCSAGVINYLVDLAIGAATEQVIIPDMFVIPRSTAGNFGPYLFPVFIPAGSRITARCQSSSPSATLDIVLTLFSGTMQTGGSPPSKVSAYGDVANSIGTNIDPGAVAHTDSAWVELTAATDRNHHWLVVACRFGDTTLAAATRWMIDLGIGAATEQEIISDLSFSADAVSDATYSPVICFPYFVPLGSRITARVRSSSVTDGDRDIWIKIYGC